MKLKLIAGCGLAIVYLFAGCSKKPSPLEIRVANLEARMDIQKQDMQKILDNLTDAERVQDAGFSNLVNLSQASMTNSDNLNSQIDKLIDLEQQNRTDIDKLMSNRTATRYPVRYVAPASPVVGFKHGMPASVYDGIVAEAERRYPTDYEMQEFVIKEQTEAYRKLHP